MRKKPYQHVQKTAKHFSPWMQIAHGGKGRTHKAGCCDCDLVHDQQFRVRYRVKGKWLKLDMRHAAVEIRVRINKRLTAARRRSKR